MLFQLTGIIIKDPIYQDLTINLMVRQLQFRLEVMEKEFSEG